MPVTVGPPSAPGSSGRALGGSSDTAMIQVVLPGHLRTLAKIEGDVCSRGSRPAHRALPSGCARGPLSRAARRHPRPMSPKTPAFHPLLRLPADLSHQAAGTPAPKRRDGPEASWWWPPFAAVSRCITRRPRVAPAVLRRCIPKPAFPGWFASRAAAQRNEVDRRHILRRN